MNPNPDPLEKLVSETLKDLPLRRAPRTLESRVLAEVARRQALPWWRKSWAYWPSSVRWLFLAVTLCVSAAMVLGFVAAFRSGSAEAFSVALARPLAWVAGLLTAVRTLGDSVKNLISLIPAHWLYIAAAGFALGYASLVGLGATAYRLFWQPR